MKSTLKALKDKVRMRVENTEAGPHLVFPVTKRFSEWAQEKLTHSPIIDCYSSPDDDSHYVTREQTLSMDAYAISEDVFWMFYNDLKVKKVPNEKDQGRNPEAAG